MATTLEATGVLPVRQQKADVWVEITSDTILNQHGRGIPIFKGSVLEVSDENAGLLIASVKAKRVEGGTVKIVPNPNLKPAAAESKKAS